MLFLYLWKIFGIQDTRFAELWYLEGLKFHIDTKWVGKVRILSKKWLWEAIFFV